jgi:alkylation response protein AidB-like acyl-CoA dehydrogenase
MRDGLCAFRCVLDLYYLHIKSYLQALRFARVCYEESFSYAHKRETFGKRLIDHPVIRLKLAHMARQVQATECWLESITYQLNTMSHQESQRNLGGPIALLKAQTSLTFEYCAREAAQVNIRTKNMHIYATLLL